jgi:hypothetical protein
MNSPDLIAMIGNLSRSLMPVQTLISGFGYLIGLVFVISALFQLKKVGESRGGESVFKPVMLFFIGALLIYLPSTLKALSNTVFGSDNLLAYIAYKPYNIFNSMGIVVQTAGLLWFVRGCVLLTQGSRPNAKEGPKGLTFIAAGILAMNFKGTFAFVNYCITHLMSISNVGSGGA